MVIRRYELSSFGETKRFLGEGDDFPEPLLFREKLFVFDERGSRIGRFSLNIDQVIPQGRNQKVIYVHISNRAFIEGKLSESIVTGTVTHKLKTLEEIRYECSEVSDGNKHERCMFLLREATKYYYSVTNTVCGLRHQTHGTIPFVEALGLVGESANALLMRKMAKKGYEGILCFKTILSNGKRCRSYYVTKLSEQKVNEKKMQVLVIYRNVTNHKRCNITMTAALTRTGQMIYLFWSNSKYFLHVDPDVEIDPSNFTFGESGLESHWNKDIQLHSMYLDTISSQMMIHRSFDNENEEMRQILADFLEYVLLVKPEDVINFSIRYFSSFSFKRLSTFAFKADNSQQSVDNNTSLEPEDSFQPWYGESEVFDEL